MKDPAARSDGVCALKTCTKKVPPAGRADGDPFHSTGCCRAYHGVIFSMDTPKSRKV